MMRDMYIYYQAGKDLVNLNNAVYVLDIFLKKKCILDIFIKKRRSKGSSWIHSIFVEKNICNFHLSTTAFHSLSFGIHIPVSPSTYLNPQHVNTLG